MTARSGAAALLLVILAPLVAHAEGSVSGTVVLPDPAQRAAPERNRGFVPRAANLLKPPRPHDPLPYLVVVLEGGPVGDAEREPPREPVRYAIVGEAFAAPVFPIVTGSSVELKNGTKRQPRIHAPARPDLTPGDPINPGGHRTIKKLELKNEAVELRDHDSAHLSGWVVGFPHHLFARVDEAGRFQIKGVPAGEWTVRAWYRDRWVAGIAEKVVVANNRDAQAKLTLPARLDAPPAAAGSK